MTLTILGRCPDGGQLGGAVVTSDLAVGARVLHASAGLAIAATQHRTDPRLGPAMLAEVAAGRSPAEAVSSVADGHAHREWRQLALLDAHGAAASYSGDRVWPVSSEVRGAHCLALGNMLVGEWVARTMVDAFQSSPGELADRLLAALQSGEAAGGETGALRSAALLVVERESFALIDLRVDDDPRPLERLGGVWSSYRPKTREFVARALDPDNVHRSSSTTT